MPGTRVLCLIAVFCAAACRSSGVAPHARIIQPGAPGQAGRVITAKEAVDLSRVSFTAADVKFMQGMIHHHAQALDMTALIPERTSRDDQRLLGQRIEVSQADEIRMMQRWLEVRGQAAPVVHDHHAPGAVLMPGMLDSEEMARLA